MLADPTTVMTATGPAAARCGRGRARRSSTTSKSATRRRATAISSTRWPWSNFVTKAWFGMPGGSAANFLKLAAGPFGVRPKGYFQYRGRRRAPRSATARRWTAQRLAARAMLDGHRRTARRRAVIARIGSERYARQARLPGKPAATVRCQIKAAPGHLPSSTAADSPVAPPAAEQAVAGDPRVAERREDQDARGGRAVGEAA